MEEGVDLLRISEVARRLGVGASRAYQMAASGLIPVVRIGRSLRVPRQAFDRWLAAQTDAALAGTRRTT